MKIVVLMGSPRKNGDTAKMTEVFAAAATDAGHEAEVFNVASMNINGCKACEYCHTKGEGACVQKDDMQNLYPALRDAEAIVFASPVYYWTMSAQLQAALHRCYCLNVPPNVEKLGMILSSYSDNVYTPAKEQLKNMADYFSAEVVGVVTSHQEEHGTDEKLAEVAELARKF